MHQEFQTTEFAYTYQVNLTKDGQISINNESISARRLITPSSGILLANVYLYIHNKTLETELKNMGFNLLLSPVSSVRAGFSKTEYDHNGSFRRQVYSTPLRCKYPRFIPMRTHPTSFCPSTKCPVLNINSLVT